LPGGASRNPGRETGLRRQESADAIVPRPSTWEGPNDKEDENLSSLRDELRKQNAPYGETSGQPTEVKPRGVDQRAEPSPALSEGASNGVGEKVWEQIWERSNLLTALRRVETNGGAPGIDGMTVEELRPYLRGHWLDIRKRLDVGTYQPSPVRRVEIPKPDGGMRLLGIPTVVDRFIQQAVAQVLVTRFEPTFSRHSYGFRPKRSAHDAVRAAQAYIREGYDWVVDVDLEKYFDRVNHDKLMARVARVVKDKQVLKLIRAYLESGVMVNGVVMDTEEGTPQGGPLSPLLANIMLDDLDKELEKRGHRFVRYADDCNIYLKSPRAGERVLASVRRFLEQRLKLKVNEKKSKVDRPARRKFLGFRLFKRKDTVAIGVAKPAMARCYERLRQMTRRTRSGRLEVVLEEINAYTRGWIGYFRLADTPSVFQELEEWLRRRLRQLLWKRWKKPRARWRNLVALGVPPDSAREAAGSGKGTWRLAASPPVQQALSNAYWRSQGLLSITERYHQLRTT
jgi:RNA-directed DNA polymerase